MTEIINNEQIIEISKELEELSNNETIKFLNECKASIFEFTKDDNNNVIMKQSNKVKVIKKKYILSQYDITTNSYIYIEKFNKLSDITNYLEKFNIKIKLKKLIKNKLFKLEIN
jgi:hypothetical protein